MLGLTATPDRADGQAVAGTIPQRGHRPSLREAVEWGELVPIRCVRKRTNMDLSRVRFNQIQYNRRDIEETMRVPSRDQLIVQTYLEHVPGRKGVVFAVNVRHGKTLAERFRPQGSPAEASPDVRPLRTRGMPEEFREGDVPRAMRLRFAQRGVGLSRR